jgi:2-C-methyl-D-erythritol 4-phosphate cytidylyltransferase
MGLAPRLVAGEVENLKVTWPGDFDLAARLLRTVPQAHRQAQRADS